MQVTPINCKPIQSFQGKDKCNCDCCKKQDKQKLPTEDVQYSTWGDNYAFPVQVIAVVPKTTEKLPVNDIQREEYKDYYNRKINSTEWFM